MNYIGRYPANALPAQFIPRGLIDGLMLSTPGASVSFSMAAGAASDATRSRVMENAAPITKTTAAFAQGTGNGGLDTGAIAANTWYHAHEILRPDTGAVDALVSLSPTAPVMPANFSFSRRVGSMRTNGAGQWTKFFQDGDFFVWDVPVADFAANSPGLAAVLRTMSTPLGVRVRGQFQASISAAGALQRNLLVTDPQQTDTAPSGATTGLSTIDSGISVSGTVWDGTECNVWTNLLSQVRTRVTSSDVNVTYGLATKGWMDQRGKDAP